MAWGCLNRARRPSRKPTISVAWYCAAQPAHHKGHRDLTPARIGPAHNCYLGYTGAARQDRLDLGGIDILTTGNHNTANAVIDEEPAICTPMPHVAGAIPAIVGMGGERCLGLAPIAAEKVRTAQPDLPRRADCMHLVACSCVTPASLDETHLHVQAGPTTGTDMVVAFVMTQVDGARARLCRSVYLADTAG